MTKRILFIDASEEACRNLRLGVASLETQWRTYFASDAVSALALLAEEPMDVVVCELQLGNLDGVAVLDAILRQHPRPLRFVLAEASQQSAMLRCLGKAHQYLVKPCTPAVLHAAIARAFALDVWLPNEAVSRLCSDMRELPSPPKLYFRVVQELQSPSGSLEQVGALVAQDPPMAARVLQAVNSATFGMHYPISDPARAILYLGGEATKSLLLLAHACAFFEHLGSLGFPLQELWDHLLRTGRLAHRIGTLESASAGTVEESYTAGMLHDIGRLALAANHPDPYRRVTSLVRQQGQSWWEAEHAVFGVSHAEVGACLAAVWGLPIGLVEAIALHHHPACFLSRSFSPLTAVHVANALDHAACAANDSEIDLAYLADLGLEGRLDAWRKAARVEPGD
jgi:HD-like signal output (HDOD) protein/CheY-like chemotaxis protein